jgi:hypothetical protein
MQPDILQMPEHHQTYIAYTTAHLQTNKTIEVDGMADRAKWLCKPYIRRKDSDAHRVRERH